MRRLVRRALQATAIAVGLVLVSTTAAYADDVTVPGVTVPGVTSDSGAADSLGTGGLTGELSGAGADTGTTGGGNATDGDGGVLSGNQVNPVVGAQITVCGNAVAVVGNAKGRCVSSGSDTKGGDNTTSGDGGVLSGNQVNPVVGVPITICGNAVAVLGNAFAWCVSSGGDTKGGDNTTSGDGGVLSGNQVNPVVGVPITICGNAIAVLGNAVAWCINKPGDTKGGDSSTSGDGGVGSGNQVNPVVDAPITICGNAVAVIGNAKARCLIKDKPGMPPGDGPDAPPGDGPDGPPAGGPDQVGGDIGDALPTTGLPDPTGLFGLGLMMLLLGITAVRLARRTVA